MAHREPFLQLTKELAARDDLSAAAKLVYAVICDRIGRNGCAWPGIRRIAADTGMSQNSVIRAISLLERVGLLTVSRNTLGHRNEYAKSAFISDAVPLVHPKRMHPASEMNALVHPNRMHNSPIPSNSTQGKATASEMDALPRKIKW